MLTGEKMPGADMLARIASARSPPLISKGSPVTRSDATGAKRDRQVVEVRFGRYVQSERAQYQSQLLSLDGAFGQPQPPVLHAEFEADGELFVVLLAPEPQLFPTRLVAECILPIQRCDDLFEFLDGLARRIEPTDYCAHADAGNGIHGNLQAFQLAQHADVRGAAGPAAAEHEADTRPLGRVLRRLQGLWNCGEKHTDHQCDQGPVAERADCHRGSDSGGRFVIRGIIMAHRGGYPTAAAYDNRERFMADPKCPRLPGKRDRQDCFDAQQGKIPRKHALVFHRPLRRLRPCVRGVHQTRVWPQRSAADRGSQIARRRSADDCTHGTRRYRWTRLAKDVRNE